MVSPVPGRTVGPGLAPAGSWDKVMVSPASAGSTATVTRCPSPNIGASAMGADGAAIAGLAGMAGMVPDGAGATGAGAEALGEDGGVAVGVLACGIVGMGVDAIGAAGAAGVGRAAICEGCAAGVSPSNWLTQSITISGSMAT